ncbi:ROK family protein [Streptomyces sp. NPDC059740]|uniref:ROK family transcriptional regulator n=1 Tax=Streptomyces sp. NPDC059740 TaxID=3346926 RepID=UPI003658F345
MALRHHNAALVLALLRAAGEAGVSRLELAAHTGLTPQAVSKITARLRSEGLAVDAGRRASTGGKPRTVLRLDPTARWAVGVHLDRDEVTTVLADLAGSPRRVRTAALDLGGRVEEVLAVVADEVAAALAEVEPSRVLGVGVASPGPLDHDRGVLGPVTGVPRLAGFPLRRALAERTGLPVVVDKDTNAAALGLTREPVVSAVGPARPRDTFAYLHLGTGLGAGLVIGGLLHRGERTAAGEFGHQVLQLDGPQCVCGKRGCVEALALAAVARGEIARAARVLGVAARNLVELLDVDHVVLGGRVALAHPDTFLAGVGQALGAPERRTPGVTTPGVSFPEAGARVVADGAAHLVLAPLFSGDAPTLPAPAVP